MLSPRSLLGLYLMYLPAFIDASLNITKADIRVSLVPEQLNWC